MSREEYGFHELASVLPMLGQVELSELAADIQQGGLREPIVLLDGKILDGRNRYKACGMVGAQPRFRDFGNGDGDPLDFIISVNIRRRHLTNAQREMVAAKIADMPRGDISRFSQQISQTAKRQYAKTKGKMTIVAAATELSVSPRNVARAKEVLHKASPDDIAAIEQGQKKVGTVARELKEKEKTGPSRERHLDRTAYPIPDSVWPDWERAIAYNSVLTEISRIKSGLEKGLQDRDVIFREITNSTVSTLKNAYGDLKCVIPYAVCPGCQGHEKANCNLCKSRGFLSQFRYETCVPKKTRELREAAAGK